MGTNRNGARTFLEVIAKACRLSHMPGFRTGVDTILGPDSSTDLIAVWTPLCTLVETLIAGDDYWNKRDASLPDLVGSEDAPFG